MGVNSLVGTLFHVGWGMYMIAETARMGSVASPACDNQDDFDALEGLCSGGGAGAAFSIFAAIAAFVAAALAKRGPLAWYPFVGSLALYTLAKVSETGGYSQYTCHDDIDAKELCSGFTAAAIFYFIAFALALAVLVLVWKMAESKHFSVSTFFAFIATFAIGTLCEYGGQSASECAAKDEDDYGDDDIFSTRCSGFGFATFVVAMAMVVGFAYAGLSFMKQNTGSNLWIGVSIYLALYFLGYTSFAGTKANVDCDVIESDDDRIEKTCGGYGAATFFAVVGTLLMIAAAFFSSRNHDGFKQATFLAGFAVYYIAYLSFVGGESAAACAAYNDLEDDDGGYNADSLQATCGGEGAAGFFAFVAFAVVIAAAVLTQLAQGAPVSDEDGQNADASAPQQEKDVPVVTAVAVAEEPQTKDGANV